ncbi:hypothetical protein ThvES_00007990 [Thiovulum sp. ES]|nr:hypothetical protein ThvES_00007990 [Thiovulum sp. ES]
MARNTSSNSEIGLKVVEGSDFLGTLIETYNSDMEIIASNITKTLQRFKNLESFMFSEADILDIDGKEIYSLGKALSEIDTRLSSSKSILTEIDTLYLSLKDYVTIHSREYLSSLRDQHITSLNTTLFAIQDTFTQTSESLVKEKLYEIDLVKDYIQGVMTSITQLSTSIQTIAYNSEKTVTEVTDSAISNLKELIKQGDTSFTSAIKQLTDKTIDSLSAVRKVYLETEAKGDLISTKIDEHVLKLDFLTPLIDTLYSQSQDSVIETRRQTILANNSAVKSMLSELEARDLKNNTKSIYTKVEQDVNRYTETISDLIATYTQDLKSISNKTYDNYIETEANVVITKAQVGLVNANLIYQEEFLKEKRDFDQTRDTILQSVTDRLSKSEQLVSEYEIKFRHNQEDIKQGQMLQSFMRVSSKALNLLNLAEQEELRASVKEVKQSLSKDYEDFKLAIKTEVENLKKSLTLSSKYNTIDTEISSKFSFITSKANSVLRQLNSIKMDTLSVQLSSIH